MQSKAIGWRPALPSQVPAVIIFSSMMRSFVGVSIRKWVVTVFALRYALWNQDTRISPEFILCSAADIGQPCAHGWTTNMEF
jgi:hypothetical protein